MYGGRGYHRSRQKVVEKVKLPRLKDFSKLSLGDLKKVKACYELYHSEDDKRLETKQRRVDEGQEYQRIYQIYGNISKTLDADIKALESEAADLYYNARKFQEGIISRLLLMSREKISISYLHGGYTTISKKIVKTPESMALKARLDEKNKQCVTARKKRAELTFPSSSYNSDYAKSFAYFCKATKTFAINGTRVEISIQDINITELEGLIQSHNRKIEKLDELKARAARNVLETRQLAQSERRKLNNQLALLSCCPYCAKDLTASDAHFDHIYPVSKGGLSRQANLIFVCSSCNIKKRDSTLRRFIEETGLDEKAIHERLLSLTKDF